MDRSQKQRIMFWFCLFIVTIGSIKPARGFCGFFVGKADTKLYNASSKVIIARQGNRNIFTMANDYQGDIQDFARIVPIPIIPTREQVRIGDNAVIEELDAFTAPRLVRYIDPVNAQLMRELIPYFKIGAIASLLSFIIGFPIWIGYRRNKNPWIIFYLFVLGSIVFFSILPTFMGQVNKARQSLPKDADLSVTVEESFTVGEYDIAILSAEQSDGLVTWLQQNDYNVPDEARTILQDYIDRDMKFFVVRVNLEAFQKREYHFLRPIILDYESSEILLPIRLGTLNATTDQDLLVYFLSPENFAKVANYRTVTIPTDARSLRGKPSGTELPALIQEDFGEFYKTMFQKAYEREGQNIAFLEYAGFTGQCDPCSIQPPKSRLLNKAGAFWEGGGNFSSSLITRLHIRYNAQNFPEDLRFQEISRNDLIDEIIRKNKYFPNKGGVVFQGRYVIREPQQWSFSLAKRLYYDPYKSQWSQNLYELTGLTLEDFRDRLQPEE